MSGYNTDSLRIEVTDEICTELSSSVIRSASSGQILLAVLGSLFRILYAKIQVFFLISTLVQVNNGITYVQTHSVI